MSFGATNGDFEPNSPITRADMAVIIDRVMDYQTKAENTFADLGTAYYTDPILRMAQAGVMQGDGKNVRPKANITRAEVVKLLDNMISDYITESGTARPKGTGIVIVNAVRRYSEQGQAEQHGRSRRQGRRSEGDRL